MIDAEGFQPLPLRGEKTVASRAEAEAILAEAKDEAQWVREEAKGLRARTLAAAVVEAKEIRADAERIREAAKAEVANRKKRDDDLDTWAARAIIAGTVGLTASGEYELARMVGFDRGVAWLLPFVIDVYVIQAFRRHRDVVPAIALTVAANVTYHLADAGLFGVTPSRHPQWWLIALVASIASLILWRIHLMVAPPKAPRESARAGAARASESSQTAAVESAPESQAELSPEPAEGARESAGESGHERTCESARAAPRKRRESKPRRRRESAANVSPIGDIEQEVTTLLTLMQERGSADEVTLTDAKRITASKSEATAARRLSAARSRYRKTA